MVRRLATPKEYTATPRNQQEYISTTRAKVYNPPTASISKFQLSGTGDNRVSRTQSNSKSLRENQHMPSHGRTQEWTPHNATGKIIRGEDHTKLSESSKEAAAMTRNDHRVNVEKKLAGKAGIKEPKKNVKKSVSMAEKIETVQDVPHTDNVSGNISKGATLKQATDGFSLEGKNSGTSQNASGTAVTTSVPVLREAEIGQTPVLGVSQLFVKKEKTNTHLDGENQQTSDQLLYDGTKDSIALNTEFLLKDAPVLECTPCRHTLDTELDEKWVADSTFNVEKNPRELSKNISRHAMRVRNAVQMNDLPEISMDLQKKIHTPRVSTNMDTTNKTMHVKDKSDTATNIDVESLKKPGGSSVFNVRLVIGYLTGLTTTLVKSLEQSNLGPLVYGYVELLPTSAVKECEGLLVESSRINPVHEIDSMVSSTVIWYSKLLQDQRKCCFHFSTVMKQKEGIRSFKGELIELVVGVKCGSEKIPLGSARLVIDGHFVNSRKVNLDIKPFKKSIPKGIFGRKRDCNKEYVFKGGKEEYGLAQQSQIRLKLDVKEVATMETAAWPSFWGDMDFNGDDNSIACSIVNETPEFMNREWIEIVPLEGKSMIISSPRIYSPAGRTDCEQEVVHHPIVERHDEQQMCTRGTSIIDGFLSTIFVTPNTVKPANAVSPRKHQHNKSYIETGITEQRDDDEQTCTMATTRFDGVYSTTVFAPITINPACMTNNVLPSDDGQNKHYTGAEIADRQAPDENFRQRESEACEMPTSSMKNDKPRMLHNSNISRDVVVGDSTPKNMKDQVPLVMSQGTNLSSQLYSPEDSQSITTDGHLFEEAELTVLDRAIDWVYGEAVSAGIIRPLSTDTEIYGSQSEFEGFTITTTQTTDHSGDDRFTSDLSGSHDDKEVLSFDVSSISEIGSDLSEAGFLSDIMLQKRINDMDINDEMSLATKRISAMANKLGMEPSEFLARMAAAERVKDLKAAIKK